MSDNNLHQYTQAMVVDRETLKPMPKVSTVMSGNTLSEQKTQVDAVTGTITFSEAVHTIDIYNRDTTNDGVFNVNGINITVPKNEAVEFQVAGTPRNTVTVTGSTSYIISRLV